MTAITVSFVARFADMRRFFSRLGRECYWLGALAWVLFWIAGMALYEWFTRSRFEKQPNPARRTGTFLHRRAM